VTIYHSVKGHTHTAWIEDERGVRVWEASGYTRAVAITNLLDALSQRDDPKAKPRVQIVEK
jgi:hypothetical protein